MFLTQAWCAWEPFRSLRPQCGWSSRRKTVLICSSKTCFVFPLCVYSCRVYIVNYNVMYIWERLSGLVILQCYSSKCPLTSQHFRQVRVLLHMWWSFQEIICNIHYSHFWNLHTVSFPS